MRTFRKSAGTLCTATGEIDFLVINFILHRYAIGLRSSRMRANAGLANPNEATWPRKKISCANDGPRRVMLSYKGAREHKANELDLSSALCDATGSKTSNRKIAHPNLTGEANPHQWSKLNLV
jgi:hypothetical protein